MDHQVQNDTNIGRAECIFTHASSFDELGVADLLFQLLKCRVEPFHMSNLQNSSGTIGQLDQFFCLICGDRDRLLNKDVRSLLQQRLTNRVMKPGGGSDNRCLKSFGNLVDRFKALNSQLRLKLISRFTGGINHSNNIEDIQAVCQSGMDSSQMPGTHNNRFDTAHAAFLRSRPRP